MNNGILSSRRTKAVHRPRNRGNSILVATQAYRSALERVLGIHERERARRQELATLREDLYARGVLSVGEYRDGQRAQAEAEENVVSTRRAIEDTDKMLSEIQEVLDLAKSGRTNEAEELLKSRQGKSGTP